MAEQTRAPTSDEAVAGTWSGAAGSRYTLVDDYPDTTPTDSLRHGTTAGNITFGFSAFTVPASATAISVIVDYYEDDVSNGTNNVSARLKVGGSYYATDSHNPATTLTQRSSTFANNPKTGAAWTVAQVNGTDGTNDLQAFGWISTDANPRIDFSSIRLRVSYTLPTLEASSAVSSAAATSAGVADADVGVTGAPASAAATSAAAGTVTSAASGACSAAPATSAGTAEGEQARAADGACVAAVATSSAAASVVSAATGQGAAAAASGAGVAGVTATAGGSVSAGSATSSGAATVASSAAGSVSAPAALSAASASAQVTAGGACVAPVATCSGAAGAEVPAREVSGSAVAPPATSSGAASASVAASGALAAQASVSAGSGYAVATAAGQAAASAGVGSAAAGVTVSAVGVCVAPVPAAGGQAAHLEPAAEAEAGTGVARVTLHGSGASSVHGPRGDFGLTSARGVASVTEK